MKMTRNEDKKSLPVNGRKQRRKKDNMRTANGRIKMCEKGGTNKNGTRNIEVMRKYYFNKRKKR